VFLTLTATWTAAWVDPREELLWQNYECRLST